MKPRPQGKTEELFSLLLLDISLHAVKCLSGAADVSCCPGMVGGGRPVHAAGQAGTGFRSDLYQLPAFPLGFLPSPCIQREGEDPYWKWEEVMQTGVEAFC